MASERGFAIRPAEPRDRATIAELIGELAPGLDPVRRLGWLYHANPQGAAVTWVAVDGATGAIAGVTSYFPFRVWIGGEVVRGAIGGDGYVRPAFRRRGIASALHATARADMRHLGFELMYGAPTGANISPLQAGGSHAVCDVVRYVRPLSGAALRLPRFVDELATRVLAPPRGPAVLDPVRPEDPRVDRVWRATRAELGIATLRDARFYTWRFVRAPAQRQQAFVIVDGGEAIATCALEQLGSRMRIVDLVAPARDWKRALAAIARHAAGSEALEIKLARPDGTRRALWRQGFLARDAKPFLVVVPDRSPRAALFQDPTHWYYTGADSDLDTLEE